MAVLVVVSLLVKECYPLSPFPMYSNLSNGAHYFYLTDGTDQPLALKPNFAVSGSDLKKKYHAYLNEVGREKGIEDAYTLGDAEQEEAGRRLFDELLVRAAKRDDWQESDTEEMKLIRVQIRRETGEIVQDRRTVLRQTIRPVTTP